MIFLDLLPVDVIQIINKKVYHAEIIEKRKIRKEKKRIVKQYKRCEKSLEKACSKYNNSSDFEFCIGGHIPYTK